MSLRFTIILLAFTPLFAEPPKTSFKPFPANGLLPKQEIGVTALQRQQPTADGRGVIVAIFDTGVDPGAEGLQTTTDGKPKIIDIVDGTGSGDVKMTPIDDPPANQVAGFSGRTLKIKAEWKQSKKRMNLGVKRAFDFFPDSLNRRIKTERAKKLAVELNQKEAALRNQIAAFEYRFPKPSDAQKLRLKELNTQLSQLIASRNNVKDPGPLYDCLTYFDGKHWRAVIDTNENGDLTDEKTLTNFSHERKFGTFRNNADLNFGVNIYENGRLLSIVSDSSPHGTHVAGIVAGHYKNDYDRSGVAPGAQIISVKIGDVRLGGMEIGRAIERGLAAVIRNRCNVVNMSFGEGMRWSQSGRIISKIENAVLNHNVVFVASAGNEGPGLRTIGAPGGASEHIIGVGALVTPAMMSASYGIDADKAEGLFTWSSRGPTGDGGTGVTIVAPGAAEAAVSHWTANRSMQMNGTSMSSPNAAGGIAVLISALKNNNVSFKPATIRRALEATARSIKNYAPLEIGAGLMQVDQAYHEISTHAKLLQASPLLAVQVGGDAYHRGVLLDQPWQLLREVNKSVTIKPIFPSAASAKTQRNYVQRFKLSCESDWVTCGENLVMTGSGRRVSLRIDPTRLNPGVWFTQVVGTFADQSDAPPAFRIPVTVIVPETKDPQAEVKWAATLKPGLAIRKAFVVPADCQWMTAQVTSKTKNLPSQLCLFDVVRNSDEREPNRRDYFVLRIEKPWSKRYAVKPGSVVEVTICQDWRGADDAQADIELQFDGWGSRTENFAMAADGGFLTTEVSAANASRTLAPSVQLTHCRSSYAPTSTKIRPLGDTREKHAGAKPAYELQLNYAFSINSKANARLLFPRHDELLYESPTSGIEISLQNERGRVTTNEDFLAEYFTLEKGNYQAVVTVRADDSKPLAGYEKMALVVERRLKSPVTVKAADSITNATSGRWLSPRLLRPGELAKVVFQSPRSLSGDIHAGDTIVGRVKFGNESPFDFGYEFELSATSLQKPRIAPTKPSASSSPFANIQANDLAKFQQEWKKRTAAGQPAIELLQSRLHWLDDIDHRKDRLPEVIAAAENVLAAIDEEKLAAHFGRRPDPEQAAVNSKMNKQKDILLDALYRKGRALGYMELPDVVAVHPIKEPKAHDEAFETNFAALARWVDPTDKKWALLAVRRERRKRRFGEALAILNRHIAESEPTYWYHKKRRDIFAELGWKTLSNYENSRLAVEFPEKAIETALSQKMLSPAADNNE